MHPSLPLVPWLGSVAVAAVAAVTDLRSGRIPNALTYPALVAGPLWHAAADGSSGLVAAVLGIAAAGVGPVLLHRRGVMGGGDVKLFGALGGLIGGQAALEVQWLSLGLVGVCALGVAAWRGQGVRGEARLGGAILLACLIVGFGPVGRFLP